MDDHTVLDSWIARLEELPEVMTTQVAPEAAEAWKETIEKQIAAGVGPDGQSWEPRHSDGAKPLQTAAKSLVVVAVGSRLVARLRGYVARHHLGRARGGVVRAILPVASIPQAAADAIRKVLDKSFDRHMRG